MPIIKAFDEKVIMEDVLKSVLFMALAPCCCIVCIILFPIAIQRSD